LPNKIGESVVTLRSIVGEGLTKEKRFPGARSAGESNLARGFVPTAAVACEVDTPTRPGGRTCFRTEINQWAGGAIVQPR
jgi:hypothetical protein